MWLRAHLMYMPGPSRFFIFNKTLDHRCEGPVEAPCFSIAIWMPLTGAGVFNMEQLTNFLKYMGIEASIYCIKVYTRWTAFSTQYPVEQ